MIEKPFRDDACFVRLPLEGLDGEKASLAMQEKIIAINSTLFIKVLFG